MNIDTDRIGELIVFDTDYGTQQYAPGEYVRLRFVQGGVVKIFGGDVENAMELARANWFGIEGAWDRVWVPNKHGDMKHICPRPHLAVNGLWRMIRRMRYVTVPGFAGSPRFLGAGI